MKTLLDFTSGGGGQAGARPSERPPPSICHTCGTTFSGDTKFCPFDGEPLDAAPEFDPSQHPLLDTVIDGRYHVVSVLGQGGMGSVYRVRHTTLERSFALKVLRRELARDAGLAERFLREARAAAAIRHPSVVEITDFGQLPTGEPYFVMELVDGRLLSWILRKGGPLPAAPAIALLRQVAQALGAAHDVGVIHRDLKPDNINVGKLDPRSPAVKVLDFGLAQVAGQSRLTRAGMVFGTPHYMSPEQASGELVDHRADIYALGVVMYEVFTGRVPFEADSYMGVLTKHMFMAPTPPSQLEGVKELGALEDVLLRCLEKKPERRYPTMAALVEDLDRVAHFSEGGELELSPSSTRPSKRPPSVLADELEPPTAGELEASLERAGIPSKTAVPPAVLGLGAALLVLGLAWAVLPRRGAARVDPPPAVEPAAPAAPTPTVESPPSPVVEPPAPADSLDPSAAGEGSGGSPTRATVSSRPARSVKAPSVLAPPKRSRSAKPAPAGGGEIVDPWSR